MIKQIMDNNKLTSEYDRLLEFMTTYEIEIENQRILRHEIKNEFRIIRAKINDNQENKEIIEYIDEIVNDKYEINDDIMKMRYINMTNNSKLFEVISNTFNECFSIIFRIYASI